EASKQLHRLGRLPCNSLSMRLRSILPLSMNENFLEPLRTLENEQKQVGEHNKQHLGQQSIDGVGYEVV
ncbi:MAG: hypothetical protein QXO71_11255, partial [Candidatus Jordarchaeaceae archaeon]